MPNNPYSPKENLKDMSEQAIEAIKGYFPDGKFEGKRQTLKLLDVSVEDNLPEEDYAMEQDVKEKDGTWAVPIKAKFALIDNETKKVVDTREMTLGRLPKMTNRFSYIIDGKERQVDHQSLLKRGMFTRIADDGKLETRFNTKTPDQYQTQFQVFFDPDSHVYQVKVGDTEAPLLPVMRAMGVPENQIKETWGAKVYQDNQVTNEETKKHLKRLYRRIARKDTDDMDELIKTVRDHFGSLSLDKEVTKMVVGKEYEKVNGDAFLSATKALLDINRGEKKPTGYDDLRFKEIRHTEDFVAERIRESAKSIIPKLKNNIDRAERVEQVVNTQIFNRPIKSFFTTSQLSTLGDQTNPLGMITGQTKHTIMGEHGISDSHQVTIDAKIIHPSSYGFLDPCHTPESSRTGINLQIPLGAWKEGKELKTRVINARTGKEEIVSATQLASANVAFPDQFELLRDKPPVPTVQRVVVADKDGQTSEVSPKDVDYVFRTGSSLFSATVNLIPFLGSNNQNRVGYGTQQAHQALALKQREEPLVQSSEDKNGTRTFEESLGRMMGHAALESGTVTKIDDRYIYIRDAAGRTVKNALYNHFPTNNKKGELHSTPLVSVGDKVEKGQPIADHSFTKGGKLALGTNLTVGYVPAEGYNFEDGVVISESAAKKMASEHLYKKEMDIGSDSVHLGRKKFMAMDQVRYTKEQLAHIGEDGVVALGTRVKPGDPLVLALKKNEVRSEAEGLSKVSKGMVSDWKADPIEWEGDYEGEVVKIVNTGKKIKVHVATLEPMQIGDKIVGRHGNKGICFSLEDHRLMTRDGLIRFDQVTSNTEVATLSSSGVLEYQRPTNIILYAHEGDMVRMKSRNVSLLCTPEHRLYVQTGRFDKGFALIPACEVVGKQVRMKRDVQVDTETPEHISLTEFHPELLSLRLGVSGENKNERHNENWVEKVPSEAWWSFMGWYVTEGFRTKTSAGSHYVYICQDEEANPRKVRRIRRVLDLLGFSYSYLEGRRFRIASRRLYHLLDCAGDGAVNKKLPRYLFEGSRACLESLWSALCDGDGHTDRTTGQQAFYSMSPTLIDQAQEIVWRLGDTANVRVHMRKGSRVFDHELQSDCYRINRTKSAGFALVSPKKKRTDVSEIVTGWSGMVGCVEVPNHLIYVVSEGRGVWVGNCTQIRPDSEMPKFIDPVDGTEKNLQVMLNPLGVPGRINAGQLLETSASLIARKTGKPYKVTNFDPRESDFTEKVEKELAALGLKPTTQIVDPKTGEALGEIHLGEQYMLKLDQQVSKKMSARGAGYGEPYDGNRTATTGGGRLGALGNFAMLAHGAVHNLREMQTIKTSFDDETWRAIQMGEPLPTPKPSYAYEKFDSFLKGMGVNVKKEGTELVLEPLTDAEVLKLSNGEVRDPGLMLRAKDLRAENGGLFDPRVFGKEAGGLKGDKWGHIKLDTAMPNPVFEEPILKLTGLRQADFENILAGQQEHNGQTGPEAIGAMLDRINVKEELKTLKTQINTAPPAQVDLLNKKIRYLSNLSRLGLTPREAYMKTVLPVLPPLMRPVSEMGDGSLNTDDLNGLYRGVGLVNRQLTTMNKDLKAIPQERGKLHAALYDGMKALTGIGTLPNYHQAKRDKLQGIMHKIEGPNPKLGFFQKNVMARKQDMSMRSTIIPNQEIQLDEIALPREGAVKMFAPHLVRELRAAGLTTLGAKEAIKKNDPLVDKVLEKVMKEVPVLAKRDPVLHKFGIQAFKPVIAKGSAIEIHPLVTGGFNADFDGDSLLGKIVIETSLCLCDKRDSTSYQQGEETMAHRGSLCTYRVIDIKDFPHLSETADTTERGTIVFEVPQGIRVPAVDAHGVWGLHEVSHFSVHHGCEEWVTRTHDGREFITSGDHSLVVFDPRTRSLVKCTPRDSVGKGIPIMRSLHHENDDNAVDHGWEIKEGEFIGARTTREYNRVISLIPFTEKVGWFLGVFIGDGWTTDNQTLLSYGKGGDKVANVWADIGGTISPQSAITHRDLPHEFEGKSYTSSRVSITGRQLRSWISSLDMGSTAFTKRLPFDFLNKPLEFRRGLFCGLMDSDGTINMDKKGRLNVSYTTKSPELASEISLLALSVGLHGSTTEYQHRDSTTYMVTFSKRAVVEASWIRLHSPQKMAALEAQREIEGDTEYGRNDVLPLDEETRSSMLAHLREMGASRKGEAKDKTSFSIYAVLMRNQPYITRTTFHNFMALCEERGILVSKDILLWASVVDQEGLGWDIVTEATPTGETKTMYDLTVPNVWTFVMENGAAVWDTMGVFAPVTKEAIQEAHKLLPSRNLINPTYNSVVPMPSQDAMVGAYMFTKMGKRTPHTYKDEKEAIEAHDKKELRHDDVIRIGGRETTVGRVLVDRFLPLDMRGRIAYGGNALDKKLLNGLLKEMALKKPTEVPRFVQAVKDYGNKAAYRGALTISLKDIKVNKELREKMFADAKKKEEAIRKQPGLSQREREQRVVELYRSTIEKYDGVLREDLKSRNSSMMTMMESGGMSKWVQVKQLSGAPIMFEDAKGEPVPVPVLRSYSEGLRLADFMTAAHGARMGTLSKSQGTSEPGYLSKKIVNSTIGITVTGSDCGTKRGVQMSVDDPDVIDRYLAEDVVAGKGRVLRKGTLVTPEIRDTLRNNKMSRVPVRSPLRCTHGDGVCAKCTGLSDQGKDYDQGTAIGVISAQALGEPATQMAMNAFHCLANKSLVYVRVGEGVVESLAIEEVFDRFTATHYVLTDGVTEEIPLLDGDLYVWDQDKWTGVSRVMRHAPQDRMIFLSARQGSSICQANHPLMRLAGEEEVLCVAEDMKDRAVRRSLLPRDVAKSACPVSGYVAGIYISEGNINYRPSTKGGKKKPYSVVFSQVVETDLADKMRDELKKWHGTYSRMGHKAYVIHSKKMGELFEGLFGRYSENKKLPSSFLGFCDEWLADFLCGYLDGDGSIVCDEKSVSAHIAAETTSYLLAQQLQVVCWRLGIHSILIQSPWRKRAKNQSFVVRVCPTEEQAKSLLGSSLRVQKMTMWRKSDADTSSDTAVVTVVKDTVYKGDWVYDLTTQTGTLTVGGLHHHNTGGVLSPGQRTIKGGGFQQAKDLLDSKKVIAGSARLAPVAGRISNVKKDPAGGFRVAIQGTAGTKEVYVPALRQGLSVGTQVKAGDALSEGTVNPHDLLPLAGLDAVRQTLTDQLAQSYGGVRKRHVEMVVRSLTDTARVEDTGGREDLVRGDVASASYLASLNEQSGAGAGKVKYTPVLKGVNYLPLQSQDWASRLNFNRLRDTVAEGAAMGFRSDIHGTNPLPGLMYGAEFGRPVAGKKSKF